MRCLLFSAAVFGAAVVFRLSADCCPTTCRPVPEHPSAVCWEHVPIDVLLAAADAGKKEEKPKVKPVDVDLGGWYRVEGKEGEATYDGMANIYQIKGRTDAFAIHWLNAGGNTVDGVLLRESGDVYVATWSYQVGITKIRGVTIYAHDVAAKTLLGRWNSLPGPGGWHEERLIFQRGHSAKRDDD